MYMIAKYVELLGEWLPLPLIFNSEAAAEAHAAKLGAGHRVYEQAIADKFRTSADGQLVLGFTDE